MLRSRECANGGFGSTTDISSEGGSEEEQASKQLSNRGSQEPSRGGEVK